MVILVKMYAKNHEGNNDDNAEDEQADSYVVDNTIDQSESETMEEYPEELPSNEVAIPTGQERSGIAIKQESLDVTDDNAHDADNDVTSCNSVSNESHPRRNTELSFNEESLDSLLGNVSSILGININNL